MKNAVNGFIDKVAENYTADAAHRISIVTFNDNASPLEDWTSVDETGKTALRTAVDGLPTTPSGATNVAAGMTQAQTQLSNAQKDHKKVVVVFTDGVPTTQSDFSTKVATDAIATAKVLKDDQTEIYTIGIFNGVNADQLYGEKWEYLFYDDVPCTGEVDSYWGGSSAASLFGGNDFAAIDVAAGNRFLNYLSSNFAEATGIGVDRGRYDPSSTLVTGDGYKITQNFERSSSDYYLTATDSENLNNVFTQISENINSAVNEQLDTKAVVKDTMTDYFNLPTNPADIKVYTQNRKADGNWADRVETTGTTVKIDGQTVTVTGYDYAKNFVSETAKADGSYGQKLVIEFTITPDLAKLAQDEAVKVDTNTGAGLYLDETAVATGESGEASFCGVKYDANGGTGTVPPTEIGANGTKFTVPASTLKKDKAVLLGFSATKRETLVTSESDAAVVTEYTPANDTLATLYAVWAEDKNGDGTPDYKEDKYTITYAAGAPDGEVTGLPDAVTGVLVGTEQTVSSAQPTREGYTFSGWQAPEGVTVTDNKFTMPAKNVTFTAQWTANDVTITFNANGGAWTAAVTGYEMGADNKTASKKFKLSDTVEKITPDPVQDGKKFSGWGVKLDESGNPSDKIVAYPLLETSATAAAHKRIFGEHPIIFYAIWEDAAQPTEKLNYTTRQHYIDEKGNEVGTVDVGGVDLLALQGTKISKLIQHLEKDQNYFGQKYLYDRTKTTVNGVAYADTMTLDTKGTAIDLYYYLDEWGGKDDETPGDNIPDCQQAVVNFLADSNGSVGKDSEKTTQVFTLKKGKDGKYSDSVTPTNVTPMPNKNFAFDIWTKDNGKTGVNPFVAQALNGGDKVTYTAHFAADKIGPKNKPDNIPDKYQAVVTYKVVGGTWKDGKTDAQVQVFTLKTKNADGAWVEATPAPVLGDTIPTGMISSYSRTASQSWDKDITKDTKVTESVTYTYTFTKGSSGGGGSSSTHYYISLKKVDAQDGEALSGAKFGLYLDGKQIATATSDRNGIVRFSMGSSNYRSLTDKSNLYCQELTAPEGYKLSNEKIAVSKKNVSTSSSTSDKNAKTVKNSRSKTPSMLNGEDHFAYIVGYPDKTVHPQSSITRAEVATIFFRLLTEETRTANATKTNKYADVSSDKWYNQAVSTLSAMGIIKGDSRGNFNPNAPITRAEFAAIAARFDKTEDVAAASFGDVAMHWAKPEISVAANNGWINGYTDGTFHPDSKITRAEAMAMINRVLQRLPESKADLLDGMIQWSDNADTSKWYYLAVQEATNSHYYELKANQHEKWTKLRENRDWTELEK